MNTEATPSKSDSTPAVEQEVTQVHRLMPDVDIYEKDGTVVLVADMPGVPGTGVDLQMEANKLSLTGCATTVLGDSEPSAVRIEYHRTFTLGRDLDRDAITAAMNQGVLRVEFPKRQEAPDKKINVSIG